MSKILIAAGALLCVYAGAVQADPAPQARDAIAVSAADLQSPAGAKAAYIQLKTAAERACAGSSQFLPSEQDLYAACVKDTLSDAVAQVGSPMLSAMGGRGQVKVLASN